MKDTYSKVRYSLPDKGEKILATVTRLEKECERRRLAGAVTVCLVSRLGFGCGGLSGIYNKPLSHEVGCSIIKETFNKGITLFDTSDVYGVDHDNEIMVGKIFCKVYDSTHLTMDIYILL